MPDMQKRCHEAMLNNLENTVKKKTSKMRISFKRAAFNNNGHKLREYLKYNVI